MSSKFKKEESEGQGPLGMSGSGGTVGFTAPDVDLEGLKSRAEDILRRIDREAHELETLEVRELLRQISVYHLGLEIQNEDLRWSRLNMEKANAYLSELFANAPVGYVTLNRQGGLLDCNALARRLFNLGEAVLRGVNILDMVEERDQAGLRHALKRAGDGQGRSEIEVRCFRSASRDGFWLLLNCVKLDVLKGEPLVLCALQDVTRARNHEHDLLAAKERLDLEVEQRRRFEHELFESRERYRAMVESFEGLIYICSPDLRITFMNQRLKERLGRDATGELCHKVMHGFSKPCAWCRRDEVFNGKTVRREYASPWDRRWYYAVNSPISHPDGSLSCLSLNLDITRRKHMEDRLKHQALHDPLTGLANRTLCLDRIRQALERSKRREEYYYGVLFLDIDRFKVVNDSLGHAFGDALLREMGRRLSTCIRDLDTISRYGGDEFVLVLEEISSPRQAIRVAKRVRAELKRPFEIDEHEVQLSASIGIVLGPTDYEQPEDLIQNANIAMHRAKDKGRDRFLVFNSRMLEHAVQLMVIENDMERGLARGEFDLVFQPIVFTDTGALHGFEALLRWNHPTRGPIPPSEFIPVAEETGMINDLGLWALNRACATMAQWRAKHPRLENATLSVNISGRQFSHLDLVGRIRRILDSNGFPPERLKLEITETALMENAALAVGIVKQLKGLGISLSIDDFGAGYSSMSYLLRLPLDNLKIDMGFVRMLEMGRENVEIVRAMVNLAHSLGLNVVAEGVEKEEQRRILSTLDCDYCQGYFFSRPMPATETANYIAHLIP